MSTPNQPPTGYSQPPAQPPKKSKAGRNIALGCGIPAGLVVILALFGGCAALLSAPTPVTSGQPSTNPVQDTDQTSTAEPAQSSQPPKTEKAKVAGIGEPVQVGDFEVTVTDIEGDMSQIGPDMLGQTADGQYVVVSVEITNTSDESAFFNSGSPKLLDGAGNEYSTAPVIPEDQGGELFGQVNPGNTTAGKIVFDIPKDVEPTRITFSGGLLSDPVVVRLS